MKIKTLASLLLVCSLLLGLLPGTARAESSAQGKVPVLVDGGEHHTVILYSDGTVSALGKNTHGQCNVSGWTDIVSIAAGFNHTLGVRSDGTVVATGSNAYRQCDVSSWRDIIQVAAGEAHTLGLRSDGTVVATGSNADNQCKVHNWKDIVQVSAGKVNSLGLTANGSVIIRGAFTNIENYRLCDWTNVVSVASGTGYFAGLHPGGSVAGYGNNTDPQGQGFYSDITVAGWKNIAQVAIGRCNAFGLTRDGNVICSGRNDFGQMGAVLSWSDIIYIAAGVNHVIGIRRDGTLVAAGDNSSGQCNVRPTAAPSSSSPVNSTLPADLPVLGTNAKLWSRSNVPTPRGYHTPAQAPGCWYNTSVPGHTSGPVLDNRGNEYTYAMHLDGGHAADYYIKYHLKGNYTTFSGVCGYPKKIINTQWTPYTTKYFEIYGDGELLYPSPAMNANTDPQAFSINVEGVKVLTILYPGSEGPNEAATLFDPRLS